MRPPTAWAFFIQFRRGEFFFIPTILHTWKKCPCFSVMFVWGNILLGVSRYCVWTDDYVENVFENLRKDLKEQTEEPQGGQNEEQS